MFIVFEGIDGAGTTTASRSLANRIQKELGIKTYWTKEPTDKCIGVLIRNILIGNDEVHKKALLHLFCADRHDHIENCIKPHLCNNEVVITDRYVFSTWVYQQLHVDRKEVEAAIGQIFKPDMVFLFDIDPTKSMERVLKRGKREMFEYMHFLKNARQSYWKSISPDVMHRLFNASSSIRVEVIDGLKLIEEVAEEVFVKTKDEIGKRFGSCPE
jgi:dTMP kinase